MSNNEEFKGIINIFTEYSLDQLYELFAKNIKDIKVMVSKELARELYTTKIWCINVNQPSSQKFLIKSDIVRGWFLLSNSSQGEVELKFIPSNIIIGKLFIPEQYMVFKKNIYLHGYRDDYIYLIWSNIELYSKIFTQIEFPQKTFKIGFGKIDIDILG